MTNSLSTALSDMPPISAWLSDMDGVLVKENRALPGAQDFISALEENGIPFLVLTNNSIFTNRDLSARLANSGLKVPELHGLCHWRGGADDGPAHRGLRHDRPGPRIRRSWRDSFL